MVSSSAVELLSIILLKVDSNLIIKKAPTLPDTTNKTTAVHHNQNGSVRKQSIYFSFPLSKGKNALSYEWTWIIIQSNEFKNPSDLIS